MKNEIKQSGQYFCQNLKSLEK